MFIRYIVFFIVSICLTYLVRIFALNKNIIDNPNERSSHSIPTPRGGGLAIVITWFGGLIYLYIDGLIEQNLFFALLSGIALAIVSLLDDILDLKPVIRLIAQGISAAAALIFLGGFQNFIYCHNPLLFWIINLGIFMSIIWFINLFNFLDGIDAYASQETILVAIGLLIFTGNSTLALLIASVSGFLLWNWPKAKIFMGDVGSTQLGYILIVLGIYFHNKVELNIINWLILTSVFWFDASFTLFRRWKNNEKLSQAHKKHAYQRLVQGGYSHLKVNIYVIVFNIFLLSITILNYYILHHETLIFLIVIIILYFFNKQIDRIFPFKTR